MPSSITWVGEANRGACAHIWVKQAWEEQKPRDEAKRWPWQGSLQQSPTRLLTRCSQDGFVHV